MKQTQFGLGEKFIETPSLIIKQNIMTWDNTIIQLSNISYISASNLETITFPFWSALLILGGFLIFGEMALLALALIAVGAVWIYSWYTENEKRKKGAILTIRMNSGHNLYFTFENKDFLLKVLDVLEHIIINGSTSSPISINIKDCKIQNSKLFSEINGMNEAKNEF